MAECLVLAIATGGGDTSWDRGHVVTIMPDGHAWGDREGLPRFWRIIVTGASVDQCWAYLDAVVDATGNTTKIRRSKFDYNSLSTPQKRALDTNGYLTVTKALADSYIKSVA